MPKHRDVLLFLSILSYSICLSNNLSVSTGGSQELSVLMKIMVQILEKCDFQLNTIIVYDDSSQLSTFKILSDTQITTAVLAISNVWTLTRKRLSNIQLDGIILVLDARKNYRNKFTPLFRRWQCRQNCTIITVSHKNEPCNAVDDVLSELKRHYFTNSYYICLNNSIPYIYTFDPYGNTQPLLWQVVVSKERYGNPWTLYNRIFQEDDACFHFNRAVLNEDNAIIWGVRYDDIENHTGLGSTSLWNEPIEDRLKIEVRDTIDILRKMLNMKFKFWIVKEHKVFNYPTMAWFLNSIDIPLFMLVAKNYSEWQTFYPVDYDIYAVFSHNRGYRTPLEKISHFYGRWTLISMIILLTITFIVVWFKTSRNIAVAAFDVVRLLIESDVVVPLDTLSIRIFFSMIFLYFMVIHATFNGHLAEFLTKQELRDNIETIEDLVDPEIKSIHIVSFFVKGTEDQAQLQPKLKSHRKIIDCFTPVMEDKSSVCVELLTNIQEFYVKNTDPERFYIGKSIHTLANNAYLYRARFPLREQFNLALVRLFEAKLVHHYREEQTKEARLQILKNAIRLEIDFRPIIVEDLKFAFIFLIIGNSLGFLSFLIEIWINQRNHKKKNQWATKIHLSLDNRFCFKGLLMKIKT